MGKLEDLMKDLKQGKILRKEDTSYLYKILDQVYGDSRSHDTEGIVKMPYPNNFIVALSGDWADAYSENSIEVTEKCVEWVLSNLVEQKYTDAIHAVFRDGKTLEEYGKENGCSKERARQRIAKAMRICRYPSRFNIIMYGDNEWNRRKNKEQQLKELDIELTNKIIEYRNKIAAINKALKEVGIEVPLEENETMEWELDNLGLSIRAYNCLKRAGFKSVKDLTMVSYDDIKNIRNLGPKCAEEVRDKVIELGLYFADENNPDYIKKLKEPTHYLDKRNMMSI